MIGHCAICNTWGFLTKHHLIPKSLGGVGNTVFVCLSCHNDIHAKTSNEQLKLIFNTVDKLKELLGYPEDKTPKNWKF